MTTPKGFYGIRPGTKEEYISDLDKDAPEAERPVATILAMTVTQRQDFYDTFFSPSEDGSTARLTKGMRTKAMEAVILPFLKGMTHWPVPFALDASGMVTLDFYESLDLVRRNDLYNRILLGAEVTPTEAAAVKS